jgi:hypothetical protein
MMSGLDLRYDLGGATQTDEPHPLLGRRMPDLDLDLLHDARPLLVNLGEPGGLSTSHDRLRLFEAKAVGEWDLPVISDVPAPTAVLIRPDGHVAWLGDHSDAGLDEVVTRWFGSG